MTALNPQCRDSNAAGILFQGSPGRCSRLDRTDDYQKKVLCSLSIQQSYAFNRFSKFLDETIGFFYHKTGSKSQSFIKSSLRGREERVGGRCSPTSLNIELPSSHRNP
uniref:Uncharacterized protein n=1 Tax=Glossina pallidipes TaxID=7398 RepID=A0A1B0A616_GLOPL